MTEDYAHQHDNQMVGQEDARRRRTIWIGVITGVLFAAFSAGVYAQTGDPVAYIWELSATTTISIISLTGAFFAWRRRVNAGGILLLAAVYASILIAPIIGGGQGLAVGALAAIFGIGVTATTLPPKYSARGNAASLLIGAIIVVINQTLRTQELSSLLQPVYVNSIALITSTIFLVIIARQFNNFTLRAKLVMSFAVITLVPLIVLGAYNNYVATRVLTQKSHERLSSLADIVKKQMDGFIIDEQNNIHTEAKQTAIIDYLTLAPQSRPGSIVEQKAKATLLSFQRKNQIFINSYAILDAAGKNVLDTSVARIGFDESFASYYTEVFKKGVPYASNVLFSGNKKSIYFSAPIKNPANQIIGVLRVEYRAIIMQSLARAVTPDDPNILVSVVDRNTYMRLAYTGNRDRLYKSYKELGFLDFMTFQSEGRMPPGNVEDVLVGIDEKIVTGIDQIESAPFFDAYSGSLGSESINTGVYMETQPWIALVRESYESNLVAVRDQTRSTILLSLALAGGAVLLALGGAQILASPLVTLTKVAEDIAAGDINARAHINTQDEIGALAFSFNRMADELNIALNGLEERVSERTADLESAQKNSEKRANELQAIGEISKIITGEQNLEILLPLITRLVSERFGFYHTGIFLINETKQFAVLQAANSEGGKRMLARSHRLALGYGIVGYVAKAGIHRIALDVGMDSVYFNNPDLPTTRSEMALPLKIRSLTIGVLDVQSELSKAFTENDAKNLSILTDQIAIAVENAQLFERTQQALNEAQMLYRQNVREGWAAFTRQEDAIGYRQTIKGGIKLKESIETAEIREAINRGTTVYLNTDGSSESYIVIPVKLRGQVIGTLDIKAPTKERQWTSDEINFVEAISERLSIALENARLIQESQRQVIKQQTIRDVTEKIGSSINLKNVLQAAVEELGRVMPGSEVILRLAQKDNHKQD